MRCAGGASSKSSVCRGGALGGSIRGASVGNPRCPKTLAMTMGSSICEMSFIWPPQAEHFMMSIANERLSSSDQLRFAGRVSTTSACSDSTTSAAGTMFLRSFQFGAKTPCV